MHQIVVIGSSNTDMVVKADKLPVPGETVMGGTFLMNAGGKGANQAYAAALLGGQVVFIAKIGNDIFGQQAVAGFERAGINTQYIFKDKNAPSGVAIIGVDAKGENSILVAPGANAQLHANEVIHSLEALSEVEWVLLQLEVPIETVEQSIVESARRGAKVILNPAPAHKIAPEALKHLFLITPNETEVELLTGVPISDDASLRQAAQILLYSGVENVVITLGAKGAFLCNAHTAQHIEAPLVTATDTTAAGDVFNGALVVALSENQPLPEAVAFACRAAAMSVTRMGAQSSVPTRREVEAF